MIFHENPNMYLIDALTFDNENKNIFLVLSWDLPHPLPFYDFSLSFYFYYSCLYVKTKIEEKANMEWCILFQPIT